MFFRSKSRRLFQKVYSVVVIATMLWGSIPFGLFSAAGVNAQAGEEEQGVTVPEGEEEVGSEVDDGSEAVIENEGIQDETAEEITTEGEILDGISTERDAEVVVEDPIVSTEVLPVGPQCVSDSSTILSTTVDWEINYVEGWAQTVGPVELGVTYVFPVDPDVYIRFTCLPAENEITPLKIQRIDSQSLNLPDGIVASTEYAYDFTTGMADGTFTYDVTLPKPVGIEDVQISYIEKSPEELGASGDFLLLDDLVHVANLSVEEKYNEITAKGIDHFTIFIVTDPGSEPVLSTAMVNGMDYVTVPPSTNVNIEMTVTTSGSNAVDDWRSSQYLIEGDAWQCVDTNDHTGDGTYSEDFNITSPTTVGVYDLSLRAYNNSGCTGGVSPDYVITEAITVASSAPVLIPPTLTTDPSDPVALTSVGGIWTSISGGSNHEGINTNEIRWGVPAGIQKSGLRFTNSVEQSFDTGDTFYLGMLTHMNWGTWSGTAANGATLQITLDFDKPDISDVYLSYDFDIEETSNSAGSCKIYQRTLTACDDKVSFPNSYGTQVFTIGDIQYTLVIDGFVDAFPSGNAVTAFVTEEEKENSAFLVGHLSSVLVDHPEIRVTKKTNDQEITEAPGPSLYVGDMVSWTYVIQNSGNIGLTDVTVTDNPSVTITCPQTELAPGQVMTCTASGFATLGQFTNTVNVSGTYTSGVVSASDTSWYLGVQRGHLIVQKTTIPSLDQMFFSIEATGSGGIIGGGVGSISDSSDEDYEVEAGTYSVVETVPQGWEQTANTCTNVVIGYGETRYCTITNTLISADLLIEKTADDTTYLPGETVTYTLSVTNDGPSSADGTTITDSVPAGLTYVSANPSQGSCQYVDSTVTCDLGSLAYTASATVIITATVDSATNGTVVNTGVVSSTTYDPDLSDNSDDETVTAQGKGTLIVKKDLTNNNGGGKQVTDFTFSINRNTPIAFDADGQNEFSVDPGTYSVLEQEKRGYSTTYDNCDRVDVAAGETETCTITNNDIAPRLTLIKEVSGGSSLPTEWTLTATGQGSTPTNLSGHTPVTSGSDFRADTYNLAESGPAGYTPSAWVCVSNNPTPPGLAGVITTPPVSSVMLRVGDDVTCTITNTRDTGTLRAQKIVDDGTDLTKWKFRVDEGAWIPALSDGSADFGQVTTLETHVIEEQGPEGYHLSSISGMNCSANLTEGADAIVIKGGITTCVFTNDVDKGSITIIKDAVVNDTILTDAQDFGFTTTGDGIQDFTLDDDGDEGNEHSSSITYSGLFPGDFTVTEVPVTGWDLTGLVCQTDVPGKTIPTSDGTIRMTLEPGENVSCTYTNDRQPMTITVTKIVCSSEAELPNWGDGGPDVTATTAMDFLTQHPTCHLESGWDFQWGDDSATNPGDDYYGEAAGWNTLGTTADDGTGSVVLNLDDFGTTPHIKVREVLKEGYIPFTFTTHGNSNSENRSAELYCHTDVLNYDNDDRFAPGYGNDYYCVAFNAPAKQDVKLCKVDTAGNPLSGWTLGLTKPTGFDEQVPVMDGNGIDALLDASDYVVYASGSYRYGNSAMIADAGFSYRPLGIPAGAGGWVNGDLLSTVGALEMKVGGNNINWGGFNSMHQYSTLVSGFGGGSLNLSIWDDYYLDNTNNNDFRAQIGEVVASGVTLEDGCVVLSDILYGEYNVFEVPQENMGFVGAAVNGEPATDFPVSVTLEGDPIEVDFINRLVTGQLIVQKTTDPAGDPTEFAVIISGDGEVYGDVNGIVTDASDYTYTVEPGQFSITETVPDGWKQTSNDCQNIMVPSDGVRTCTITNEKRGVLQGRKFSDLNLNGEREVGEPWLDGWTMNLYDGSWSYLDFATTAIDTGIYRFDDLDRGTYYVCELLDDGWAQTSPVLGGAVRVANGSDNTQEGDVCWKAVIDSSVQSRTGLHFGNVQLGSIDGAKYEDVDGNGDWYEGDDDTRAGLLSEPLLDGWTIFIDENGNGQLDTDEKSVVTGENSFDHGHFGFEDLLPGEYSVCEVTDPGWKVTEPDGTNCKMVHVAPGEAVEGVNFGNFKLGKVDGYKYRDTDLSGSYDSGEDMLSNWEINLYRQKANGTWPTEPTRTRTTDDAGMYRFNELFIGNYMICETLQAGWKQTQPGNTADTTGIDPIDSTCHYFSITNSGQEFLGEQGFPFGNIEDGKISGMKWEDMNGDGIKQDSDTGIEGWKIRLCRVAQIIPLVSTDSDGTSLTESFTDRCVGDPIELSTISEGSYSFENLPLGTYFVWEQNKNGWIHTTPRRYEVTLTGDEYQVIRDFGNFELGIITGVKCIDPNGDGNFLPGHYDTENIDEAPGVAEEPDCVRLPGVTINLYRDSNGNRLLDETDDYLDSSVTDEKGRYRFTDLMPRDCENDPNLATVGGVDRCDDPGDFNGLYFLTEDMSGIEGDWIQTRPSDLNFGRDYHRVMVRQSGRIFHRNFGNFELGEISGYKWNDQNGDGYWDKDESALENWDINLCKLDGEDTILGTDECPGGQWSKTTGTDGMYHFDGLFAGEYRLFESMQPGWVQSSPASPDYYDLKIQSGTMWGGTMCEGQPTNPGIDVYCTNFGNYEVPSLKITKSNNALGDLLPGDSVTYTLVVTALNNAVEEVSVFDTLPKGFTYRSGSGMCTLLEPEDIRELSGTRYISGPTGIYSGGIDTWDLGDMLEDEVCILTYIADIADTQKGGSYPDIAMTWGSDKQGNRVDGVDGDSPEDPSDIFVGTKVNVITPSVAAQAGVVLGAEDVRLQQTGQNILVYLIGALVALVGVVLAFVFKKKGSKKLMLAMILGIAVTGGFLYGSVIPVSADSGDVVVSISTPQTPVNVKTLPLEFSALDRLGRGIEWNCYYSQGDTVPAISFANGTLASYGGSASCPVDSSVITSEGKYSFRVDVNAVGGADLASSDVVKIEYDGTNPGNLVSYTKVKVSNCEYTLTLKTANDAGDTVEVEIFRSALTSFTADASTLVKTLVLGSNTETTITDTLSGTCPATSYYALRAVDRSGNTSAFTTDTYAVVTTTYVTPAAPVGGAGVGEGAVAGAETAAGEEGAEGTEGGEEGEVLGEEEDSADGKDSDGDGIPDSEDEDTEKEDNGGVNWGNVIKIAAVVLGIGVLVVGFVVYSGISQRKK